MLTKNLPVKVIFQFSIVPVLLATVWTTAIVLAYQYVGLKWLAIPFLPISLLGIAVSFYLGFKNTSSNERQNEARKNWGAITNDTRAWISLLDTYLPDEAKVIKKEMLLRHIAWLHAHQFFLRHKRMDWEHNLPINNQYRKRFQKAFDLNTTLEEEVKTYVSAADLQSILHAPNAASQVLQLQSHSIKTLRQQGFIEDFRMYELQNHITKLYEHQGKNERIKTFPIPRQYANYAYLFVVVFVVLLPLGLLSEMQKANIWFTVPFSVLLSWVFLQMELVGDYSEHPFEGLLLDIPMTAITRNLEIEIRHAMGEPHLLQPIAPQEGILM